MNTSANLCHIAYIQGCVDRGDIVDVVSMSEKGCNIDTSIKLPKIRKWYNYCTSVMNTNMLNSSQIQSIHNSKLSFVYKIYHLLKDLIKKRYKLYPRTQFIWARNAMKFKSDEFYDVLISLATPYISHKVAADLIKMERVKCKKWIQIWEDPWSLDLYNSDHSNKEIENEERKLISKADEILYVTPLTLKYQAKHYPESSGKMKWMTLPYYYKKEYTATNDSPSFGYFGDYYSFSRNIIPFYESAKELNIKTYIYGNSDLTLKNTSEITIRPRVPLDVLGEAENRTDVLVFLCNLRGGQIPGKLYQYSATNRKILFILDGTDEEKFIIKENFEQYHRYYFCENTKYSISEAITKIINNSNPDIQNYVVEEFSPKNTMNRILKNS